MSQLMCQTPELISKEPELGQVDRAPRALSRPQLVLTLLEIECLLIHVYILSFVSAFRPWDAFTHDSKQSP